MDAARRYIDVLAFVALWMSLGSIFHLDTNFYLLIGVPLVVFFQRFVRQPPLRQLWVLDAAAFRLLPGWNCNRRASNSRAWIRLNIRRSTKKVVGCCPVAFVCLGWRCICCVCNYSAACKRRSPRLAQLHNSCAHRYGNHGSERFSNDTTASLSPFEDAIRL